MFERYLIFSLFYRELKEALVLMELQGKRGEEESKVLLHIYTEEHGLLEIFECIIFSQVREAYE